MLKDVKGAVGRENQWTVKAQRCANINLRELAFHRLEATSEKQSAAFSMKHVNRLRHRVTSVSMVEGLAIQLRCRRSGCPAKTKSIRLKVLGSGMLATRNPWSFIPVSGKRPGKKFTEKE